MLTPSSPGLPNHFDTGPLSWVMGEIREALARSTALIEQAAGQDIEQRPATLRHARLTLHQANGALQMVDADGVTVVIAAGEEMLEYLAEGKLALTETVTQALSAMVQAVTEYLEELLAGAPHQPVRLFPYYKAVLQARGIERVPPSDLFFPNPAIRPQLPAASGGAGDSGVLRLRYEKALLSFLKSSEPSAEMANATVMHEVLGEVESWPDTPQRRAFWWVMRAFASLVANGALATDLAVKQLFGRINLQLRRLGVGDAPGAGQLLRDALFFIALAEQPTAQAQQVRRIYQLEGMVPADFERRRYGRIDSQVLALAREQLAMAKSLWNRVAAGDVTAAARFDLAMHGLTEAGARLDSEPLAKLLRELSGIARHAAHSNPGDSLGLEVAGSLLFIENALAHASRLADDFPQRADALTARLLALVAGEQPEQETEWLDDMSRNAQQRQTMLALAAEMQANLVQVEKLLDEYFGNPERQAVLGPIDGYLHQIEGALAIVDQGDAQLAVGHIRQQVRAFSETGAGIPGQEHFRHVAENVGALSFFLENLQTDSADAGRHFVFDRERGMFQSRLLESGAAAVQEILVEPLEGAALETAAAPEAGPQAGAEPDTEPEMADATATMALDEVAPPATAPAALPAAPELPAPVETQPAPPPVADGLEVRDSEPETDAALDDLLEPMAPEPLPVAPEPLVAAPLPASEEAIDAELLEIFLAEAEEVLAVVRSVLPELRRAPGSLEHMTTLRRSFHTLKGSSRMVGLHAFGNAAWAIEQVFNRRLAEGQEAGSDLYHLLELALDELGGWVGELQGSGNSERTGADLAAAASQVRDGAAPEAAAAEDVQPEADTAAASVPEQPAAAPAAPGRVIEFSGLHQPELRADDNIKYIGALEISVPLHNIYLAETDELVRVLAQDLGEWRHEPLRAVNVMAVHAAHSLAGSSATVGFSVLQEVAHGLEMVLQTLARKPVPLDRAEFDLLERSVAGMKSMLQKFALCEMPPAEPGLVRQLKAMREAVATRELAPPAEAEVAAEADAAAPAGPAAAPTPATLPEPEAELGTVRLPADELDADLLPVFLEEARDILPQLASQLRAWQQSPQDAEAAPGLQRLLHTLKGSARMAGAMALGQHMHDMESRIETITRVGVPPVAALEDLLARLDYGLFLFDKLQHPQPAAAAPLPAVEAAGLPVAPLPPAAPAPALPAAPAAVAPGQAVPLVRVRADLLDRLVNQAGEVSITRSRMESEVSGLRNSLTELTENLGRLRGQLREIEIQAETQMASQSQSSEREFDPLEFDRFTRLQELTRMMAETVSDIATVQQHLNRTVDGTGADLITQARLTRELQQDLMRVRMVQFASISERLYRVTRKASKELDKRVNLDIQGGAVEMDRSVLERMTGPFEHLLRNAIVHGVEERAERLAAGKTEAGELLIEVRQEGNEVVLQFSDDGRGLDLERIRARALERGLLAEGGQAGEHELKEMIFQPGFSTAREVTELAGRGVGMDVVRSEAMALGGRVAIDSQPGRGTRFTIHLPLTLAVTQVVILGTGARTFALPSVLVEQVQQLKANALAAAYNDGALHWQGRRVPLYYLPALLGDHDSVPVTQQYSPVVIVRNGNERVAIHVDEVQGNREVVVKNIGPQLARMPGIAGATVLGSGDIVLILNPVPLARRRMEEEGLSVAAAGGQEPAELGAVAEMTLPQPLEPRSDPVQGLRTQPIVMVVDDSLTVRRVTQRLLAREGYQVVLAKDGVDALEQLQAITPDVMLVDIEMPRMDGFDLTRNVRGDIRSAHIPIVMITSRTATKHRNYALELGVNEYLGKPYQEQDLLRLIAGFVLRAGGQDREPVPG